MDLKQTNYRFFLEKDAIIFEQTYFNLWHKGIDKRWFWLAFQALEKSGLTYFENEVEEMIVRERLQVLAILYYEYCHRSAAHESEYFTYWTEDLINNIKNDLSGNVEEIIYEVKEALIKYFQTEKAVTDELWFNCFEGRNNIILPLSKKEIILSDVNINMTDAEEWFKSDIGNINHYEGISL